VHIGFAVGRVNISHSINPAEDRRRRRKGGGERGGGGGEGGARKGFFVIENVQCA